MSTNNIIPLMRRKSFWNDQFIPPELPILLELRKCMGLTPEEASSVLHVRPESLEAEECLGYPKFLNDIDAVLMRYLFFLSVHGNKRERNLISNCFSLREIRRRHFKLEYKAMGHFYGGYTARQWYHFEMHDEILPRDILEQIRTDLRKQQSS